LLIAGKYQMGLNAQDQKTQAAKMGDAGKPPAEGRQAIKSAQTRSRLVEATIRCLVKHGFAKTSTPKVAEEAELSRGAMLHHFESGRELMQATLKELHQKRLRAFRRSADSKSHNASTLVHAYWKQLLRPTFIAFQELAIAARTDKELAAILQPINEEFQKRWYEMAVELFPEWADDKEKFKLALMLSQNLLEGLAINRLTGSVDDDAIEPLLKHLEQQILELRPGG